MIFNVQGHIDMIRNGIKTQTRRPNRGIYKVGKDYAVQRKRGVKAESDIRIVMDRIWEEERRLTHLGLCMLINHQDAWAEGGYTPEQYEKVFRELNPKWDGLSRWAFAFHVIEVRNNVPGITSHAREERVRITFYPEQTAGYPRL